MGIQGKHIAILVYGPVDIRTKKSARALAKARAHVTILALSNTHTPCEGEPFTVQYILPKLPAGSTIPWRPLRISINLANRFINQFASRNVGIFGKNNAIKALLKLKPDVIHAINPDTIAAGAESAAELNVPYIYEAYEFWPDHALSAEYGRSPSLREEMLRAERNYIVGAAAVITVSPYLAREYSAIYGLCHEPETILNALPDIAERVSRVHTPLRILFLGSLQPERNIILLLQAAVKIPDISVTFQGDGVMSKEICEFARLYNIENRIIVKKPVDYSDIADSASEHDVGIICHRAYDRQMRGALPNKFFEYLSGGLAIIATDTDAFREFPGFSEFGILFDVERDGAFVEALEGLLHNPEKVAAMKESASQAAQLYCGDAQARKLRALYNDIQGQVHEN